MSDTNLQPIGPLRSAQVVTWHRWRAVLASVVIMAFLAVGVSPCAFADDADESDLAVLDSTASSHPAPATDIVAQFPAIGQLESTDFVIRRQATRDLLAAGPDVIPALSRMVEAGSLEVAIRALEIIEQAYVSHDLEAVSAADSALEHLLLSENRSVAVQAGDILGKHSDVRQVMAVARIHELGGLVKDFPLPTQRVGGQNRMLLMGNNLPHVRLGPEWKGGTAGLKYIHRLKGILPIAVYLIDGVPLSEDNIADFELAFRPNIVQRRGGGFLGIQGHSLDVGPGCLVKEVVPGATAERAGILANDRILAFDEQPVDNFEHLIELIKKKRIGDKFEIHIRRGVNAVTLPIELGDWPGPREARQPPGLPDPTPVPRPQSPRPQSDIFPNDPQLPFPLPPRTPKSRTPTPP